MPEPDPLDDRDLSALLLIRRFEERLLALFAAGEVSGTTHTCLGQEYIPVALSGLLRDGDQVVSNHRGHGHYLARYDDPAGLLAEILGRAGALCDGVGGSQHLHRAGYLSTGVQGQSLPVALGIALHLRRVAPGRLALVYIGDGTWGAGAVYEALNMARLWRAPLLVAVEHNGIAQSTPTGHALAGSIAGRVAGFGIAHQRLDTDQVGPIRDRVAPLVTAVRTGHGPAVLEFRTRRLGPHSKGDDTRDTATLAALRARDWAGRYARRYPTQFAAVDRAVAQRLTAVVDEVRARPPAAGWRA